MNIIPPDYLTLSSPAKINLSLRVGNLLSTGFHQIVTTIAPIDLCDEVGLRITNVSESTCKVILGEGIVESSELVELSSIDKNIAARAAKKVLGENNFDLVIVKNTPIQAGLGGGSGNAATALLLANQLLANQLRETTKSLEELVEIASTLGSDIGPMLFRAPVVQSAKLVVATVIPEEIKEMELLLVKPPTGVSTKEAYMRLNRPEASQDEGEFSPTFALENDFEEVFFLESWFQEGSQCLLELEAQRVLLCGSGSAIVGFFEPGCLNENTLKVAKNRLKNWWVYQTRFWS